MFLHKITSFRPTSLKQKTVLFILLPIFLIMVSFGGIGEHLVRQVLLEQWQETAITKLQRFAHYVDMRLMRPKEILDFLQKPGQRTLKPDEINLMLEQLRSLDGVVLVNQYPVQQPPDDLQHMLNKARSTSPPTAPKSTDIIISPLEYNTATQKATVSLYAKLQNDEDPRNRYIEVVLSFYDLIDQIVKSPWWKNNQAFIVDDHLNILTSTSNSSQEGSVPPADNFGLGPTQAQEIWQSIQAKNSGTIFGNGSPPDHVCGFFHLIQAPWTLVIIAPGKQVLKPILEFRKYYYLIGWLGIIAAVLYLRLITEKTTRAIKKLSKAVEQLAGGTFSEPLTIESRDEVGVLTANFNVMSEQLQERMNLQRAMDIAREVQQNLLPQECFVTEGLEISGTTIYCDATGGDYIDLVRASHAERKATLVVGDVVGHGIGAALLMATTRALLRGRAHCQGKLEEIADDVNKILCRDTAHTGNFVTLFYLQIDRAQKIINWVRCGHEAAMLYCPGKNSFQELHGQGVALGVDPDYAYTCNSLAFPATNQVLFIGSDGVWEVQNEDGEQFGKERVKASLKAWYALPAETIITKISEQIRDFRGCNPQDDDITLAVIKTW